MEEEKRLTSKLFGNLGSEPLIGFEEEEKETSHGGKWLEAAAAYCAGYDLSTYRRHDGVEVKAGPTTPLN